MNPLVSIVIPTLDEADVITALVDRLMARFPGVEIVVCDGGSRDGTPHKVQDLVTVVFAEKGRARQMNAGARAASGEILWFLHADCWPSDPSVDLILQALEDPDVVGGGRCSSTRSFSPQTESCSERVRCGRL